MADTDDRTSEDVSSDFDTGEEAGTEETEGQEADEQEQEPRTYTEDELQEHVTRATSAVQSTKDRRIANLEAQIRQMRADEPVPQFRDQRDAQGRVISAEAQELAWHRQQNANARAMRSTELRIAEALDTLSERVGVEIRRDDKRIDVRTAESFEASLAAIEREEALRKQLPKGKAEGKGNDAPKRRDAHRYEGGSGGARQTYDPKKFENTGNVYEALRAKSAAQGHR